MTAFTYRAVTPAGKKIRGREEAISPHALSSASAVTNTTTGALATALGAVRSRVERGDTLAAALADHPEFFSPIYVGVIRAGERSGDLPGAVTRLSAQLEREE